MVILFRKQLQTIEGINPYFRVTHWISRETVHEPGMIQGRISAKTFCNVVSDMEHPLYFICGSSSFTRSMFALLRSFDIPHTDLYTKGFH